MLYSGKSPTERTKLYYSELKIIRIKSQKIANDNEAEKSAA